MTWLLRLYPRGWRRRYGAEVEAIVASQPASFRMVMDLLGGAIDAHLKPQPSARSRREKAADDPGGQRMLTRLKECREPAVDLTVKESLLAGGMTIGAALIVTAILFITDSPMAKAIVLTMFPGIIILPLQARYVRGHSWIAQALLLGGPLVILFLIGLAAGLVTSR